MTKPKIIIIGGGFGGLYAAKQFAQYDFPVTLIDRENYHLFQPLLYQVATGFLPPSDIAAPLRLALSGKKSVTVIQDEIISIDPEKKSVISASARYFYDYLVVASGVTQSYFGHPEWSRWAPGIKGLDDALTLRARILGAFEAAEKCKDARERESLLTFMIVGGGPTGVELAGAVAELASQTLKGEFRHFDPKSARIILCEGGERILPAFQPASSRYAAKILKRLNVEVLVQTFVTGLSADTVEIKQNGKVSSISTGNVIWAAGVKASALGEVLHNKCAAPLDGMGRVKVQANLTLPNFSDIFVIGDLACFEVGVNQALPGVAQVAMQQGQYVARHLNARQSNKICGDFVYYDKGNMAVIGKGHAVAENKYLRLQGYSAWLAWAFVHIYFLIEFESKIAVFWRWAWNYMSNRRGARLITKR